MLRLGLKSRAVQALKSLGEHLGIAFLMAFFLEVLRAHRPRLASAPRLVPCALLTTMIFGRVLCVLMRGIYMNFGTFCFQLHVFISCSPL